MKKTYLYHQCKFSIFNHAFEHQFAAITTMHNVDIFKNPLWLSCFPHPHNFRKISGLGCFPVIFNLQLAINCFLIKKNTSADNKSLEPTRFSNAKCGGSTIYLRKRLWKTNRKTEDQALQEISRKWLHTTPYSTTVIHSKQQKWKKKRKLMNYLPVLSHFTQLLNFLFRIFELLQKHSKIQKIASNN